MRRSSIENSPGCQRAASYQKAGSRTTAGSTATGWVLKQANDRLRGLWGRYFDRTSKPHLCVTANDEWIDTPDYGAYFGDGLVHYVASSAGTDVQSEARIWVNKLVSSQDPDQARWLNRCRLFTSGQTNNHRPSSGTRHEKCLLHVSAWRARRWRYPHLHRRSASQFRQPHELDWNSLWK